mmetsp:Transcript_13939/g.19239  ORF Transcript_13939/g.19239 Transcript_13939/m.19239 type:complete len:257 (+) Transcript_13939:88-858(+)
MQLCTTLYSSSCFFLFFFPSFFPHHYQQLVFPPSQPRAQCVHVQVCLEDRGGAHARADAHADHAVPLARAPQVVQQRGNLPRPGAAQGVAERDGPAQRVYLLGREAEVLHAVGRLAREGLVDLEHVDVPRREARAPEGLGDGEGGPHAHHLRGHAHHRVGEHLAQGPFAECTSPVRRHEQYGGSAVRHLRGVTGSGGATLLKGRAQGGELIRGGFGPDAFIRIYQYLAYCAIRSLDLRLYGHNLLAEHASILSCSS